jgi:hypothetical protein
MKTAVVVGVLPQELWIVIGFYKDEIGIDALFDKPLPFIKISHDHHLSTDTMLAAVDHEPEIVAIGLMGDRNGAEEKFPYAKRLVREWANLWDRVVDRSGEKILQLPYTAFMTPYQRTVLSQNPQGGSADMILVHV